MLKPASIGRFLLAVFLCFGLNTVGLAADPIGYVIYREKGFHPAAQARLIEVQSLKAFAAVTKVVTVAGSPMEIPNGVKPEFIPLPAYDPTAAETAKVKIAAALQQYPQHKMKLVEAQKAWADYGVRLAKVNQESTVPVKKKDTVTFTTQDGREFKAVEVTRADPDGISILTETGILKIPFEQLPEQIQKQFKYDPAAAETFRQKLADNKQKVETAKQQTEDSRVRELTTVSKQQETDEKSRPVTLPAKDVDLLISKIEERGTGTVYQDGRESPVIKGFNLFMTWQEAYANVSRMVTTPFIAEKSADKLKFSDSRQTENSLGWNFCTIAFSPKDNSITDIRFSQPFIDHLFQAGDLPRSEFFQRFAAGYKMPLQHVNTDSYMTGGGTFGPGVSGKAEYFRHTSNNGWTVSFVDDTFEGLIFFLTRIPSRSDTKFGD